jgi:hypothetical protein
MSLSTEQIEAAVKAMSMNELTPLQKYYRALYDYRNNPPLSGPWIYNLEVARHKAHTCSSLTQELAGKGIFISPKEEVINLTTSP